MTVELLTGLAIFALVSSITPGPNNIMLMASGANFGFWRTSPHMLGVALGFVLMVVLVGLGLIQLFDAYPVSYQILKIVSVVYLLYLAFRIATAAPLTADRKSTGRPMTFFQAVLFQWVNPKAWTMALTAISIYSPSRSLSAIALVAAIFGVINLPSVGLWAAAGQQLGRWMHRPGYLRVFNVCMAALLVASLYPVIAP